MTERYWRRYGDDWIRVDGPAANQEAPSRPASEKQRKMLEYLEMGVPQRVLADVFELSTATLSLHARKAGKDLIRGSRRRENTFAALLNTYLVLSSQGYPGRWDSRLLARVESEIWESIKLPPELQNYILSRRIPQDSPYDNLLGAILKDERERNARRILHDVWSAVLAESRQPVHCTSAKLAASARSQLLLRILSGKFQPPELTQPDKDLIDEMVNMLPHLRSTMVIRMRFGFDEPPQSFEEIAQHFGRTRERIRQIQEKALRVLRRPPNLNRLRYLLSVETKLDWFERQNLKKKPDDTPAESSPALPSQEDRIEDLSIGQLTLSVRAYNGLWQAGIRTVGELVEKNEKELLRVKNLGRKSLQEIQTLLSDMNLGLAGDRRT